jgi:hypothetical protein
MHLPFFFAYAVVLAAPFNSSAQMALPGPPDMRPAIRPGAEMEKSGWQFEELPRVEAVDEKSGMARFRLVINASGRLDSVVTVSSTVSAKQEMLFRKALQTSRFVAVGTQVMGATGFYTFKIKVR